jgi:hypothetical protein
MKTKIPLPKFMTGKLYFVDEFNINESINVVKVFDNILPLEEWNLNRGIIIPNDQYKNEKLKFDIVPSIDYWECNFSGFLYSDGTLLGKIKYIQDAKLPDVNIRGNFKKINKNRILIRGIWEETNGVKYFIWIELTHEKQKTS